MCACARIWKCGVVLCQCELWVVSESGLFVYIAGPGICILC